MIPGVPGKIGLGLTGDETPVDCTDVVALGNGQDSLDGPPLVRAMYSVQMMGRPSGESSEIRDSNPAGSA